MTFLKPKTETNIYLRFQLKFENLISKLRTKTENGFQNSDSMSHQNNDSFLQFFKYFALQNIQTNSLSKYRPDSEIIGTFSFCQKLTPGFSELGPKLTVLKAQVMAKVDYHMDQNGRSGVKSGRLQKIRVDGHFNPAPSCNFGMDGRRNLIFVLKCS